MIICNGHIRLITKSGGGIDPETGFVIKTTRSWGSPIECQYRANEYNNKGKTDGNTFVVAKYEILVERQEISSEQIQLSDKSGNILGEYSVVSIDQLDAVDKTKITV